MAIVPRYLLGQSDDLWRKVHFQVENISLASLAWAHALYAKDSSSCGQWFVLHLEKHGNKNILQNGTLHTVTLL